MPLTTKAIENAKKQDRQYFLKDGEGLRVAINPTGSKVFQHRIRWKLNGIWKEVVRTLGNFPRHSLKEARDWRDTNNDYKAKGILPPKKYDSINQVDEAVTTFKDVYEMWFDKQKNGWKESHAIGVQQKAEKYLLPPLSNLPIDSIETKMLIDLLLKIDEEGKFETREKVQSIVTRIISHAVGLQITKTNPAREISSDIFTKRKDQKNFSHVSSPKDIKLVLTMLKQVVGSIQVITALNLAPHVFLRPSELVGIRWSEIDWDEGLIRIPAERMKIDNKPHIVPMSNHVTKVLTKLKDSNIDSTLCFPSPLKNGRPISTNSILQAMRQVGVDKDLTTVHGFRHMAVTSLNEKGYNADAIELQVAHQIRGVRGVYNHAKYLEERKPMMEDWSNYLDNLLTE